MAKILIVDDSRTDLELLKEILLRSDENHEIQTIESGETALQQMKKDPADLILLDVQMPDIDGVEFYRRTISTRDEFLPVIFVTASPEVNVKIEVLQLGAVDYLTKPIDPKELRAKVNGWLSIKKIIADTRWSANRTNEGIKLLYKELEQKNQQLEKLDQLKSNFVSTVSHELRTPLAITTEGISLVIDKIVGPINEEQKRLLITAKDNITRLTNIINDLLDISKIEAGRLELKRGYTDIVKLLTDLIASYQTVVAPKKLTLNAKLPSESVFLYIDNEKIIQAINNLLNNAIKFTPEGGTIELVLSLQKANVLLSVNDNGIGLEEDDLKKLFRKFQQFGRTSGGGAKGTGLGLSITKALIELHGGKIWAESTLNQGTTFFVTLPNYDTTKSDFDKKFDEILKELNAEGKCGSFILIDVDFEKHKNSSKKIFMEISSKIVSAIRQVVSRPRDEVFLYKEQSIYILLSETDKSSGILIVRKIKEVISRCQFAHNQKSINPDIKFGLSVFPLDANNRHDLINVAQKNMEKDKIILIVDDHPQIVRILEIRLKSKGYKILYAYTGKEALRLIEEVIPNLIILDIMMPEMNGYEVFGRLKENPETTHIPVMMLTAQDVDLDKMESIAPGGVPIVRKTGGFENVVKVIDDLL